MWKNIKFLFSRKNNLRIANSCLALLFLAALVYLAIIKI